MIRTYMALRGCRPHRWPFTDWVFLSMAGVDYHLGRIEVGLHVVHGRLRGARYPHVLALLRLEVVRRPEAPPHAIETGFAPGQGRDLALALLPALSLSEMAGGSRHLTVAVVSCACGINFYSSVALRCVLANNAFRKMVQAWMPATLYCFSRH